ncbi:MAG TPA: hypothetical protein VNM43_08730 [Dehalococcoidia bacterium]|nr:hypothetical protein [Dehalococcoidia bacterium]
MFGVVKFFFLLTTTLFGAFVLVPTVLAAGLFALATLGDPGPCRQGAPSAWSEAELASAFDAKWNAVQYQAAMGQEASVTFTEDEVTARAARFLEDQGRADTVRDLRICFRSDGAIEASGVISPPVGPDFAVRGRGHVSVPGPHPAASIADLRIGSVPGFISGLAAGPINDFLQSQFEAIVILPRVEIQVTEGQLTLTARPYASAHGPGDGQGER